MMDIAQIERRLNEAASARAQRGDHDLNPDLRPLDPLRPAAVLVPLIARKSGVHVLLTRRTDDLEHHPGQISFPGGHMEPTDRDAPATALRETHEEIGLPPERVNVVGRLDDYVTRTGFHITPIVGVVHPPFDLIPDPREVAEVFEVPLAFFLDPTNHERHERQFEGRARYYYAMPFGRHFIWGATAGMLMNLYHALTGQGGDAIETARVDDPARTC